MIILNELPCPAYSWSKFRYSERYSPVTLPGGGLFHSGGLQWFCLRPRDSAWNHCASVLSETEIWSKNQWSIMVNHGQSMSIRIFSMKHGHEMGGIFAVSYPVSCQAPKMVAVLKVWPVSKRSCHNFVPTWNVSKPHARCHCSNMVKNCLNLPRRFFARSICRSKSAAQFKEWDHLWDRFKDSNFYNNNNNNNNNSNNRW